MSNPPAAAPGDRTLIGLPDGGELDCQIRGEGEPLLLVRPLGGSIALWGAFAEDLAARFRVIAFDARGAGRSSRPRALTSTRSMAADARALLDALGVESCHVFGISLGGMVASTLAVDAPERVRRLVLAATLARGASVSPHSFERGARFARCFLRVGASALNACLVETVLTRTFRAQHSDEVRRIVELVRSEPASRAGLLAHAGAAATHDLRDRLGELRVPTRVMFGAHDRLLRLWSQVEIMRRIPGATFEVVADCGHDLTLEQPAETARRVADFLAP